MGFLVCPNCGSLTSERASRLHSCMPCYWRLAKLVPLVPLDLGARPPLQTGAQEAGSDGPSAAPPAG
jgi:hypothetical protein